MTLTDGSTLASSSMPTIAAVKFMPAPPYSSGISMPMRPCSKHCSTTAGSMASASSMARALGSTASRANLRTCSAMSASVSDRCVMGVGGTSVRSCGSPVVVVWRHRGDGRVLGLELSVDGWLVGLDRVCGMKLWLTGMG